MFGDKRSERSMDETVCERWDAGVITAGDERVLRPRAADALAVTGGLGRLLRIASRTVPRAPRALYGGSVVTAPARLGSWRQPAGLHHQRRRYGVSPC